MSTFVDVTDWPDEVKQEYGRAGLLFDSTEMERSRSEAPKRIRCTKFGPRMKPFLDRYNTTEWKYYIWVEE